MGTAATQRFVVWRGRPTHPKSEIEDEEASKDGHDPPEDPDAGPVKLLDFFAQLAAAPHFALRTTESK